MNKINHNKGFTMMEVLVTIVILSIGLLGLAGLQASSIRNNQSADHHSQAAMMIYDLSDRIRANRNGMAAGNYNAFNPMQVAACNTTAACTAFEMATNDMFEWNNNISNTLPNGSGTITGAGAGNLFTITVRWNDDRTGATGTGCSGNSAVDLACLSMSFLL
ncbi:MAG: type IV pilus modification protein PilV [Gammaproteobacteria bacterium RBG_16_57_12]|nr:MAG: type IV pilus modification protein PilV [Gammaproteobacteria bacterium RBG_16_57_12]